MLPDTMAKCKYDHRFLVVYGTLLLLMTNFFLVRSIDFKKNRNTDF